MTTLHSVVVVGQIIMYGTLVLSIYKNDERHFYIDVDSAPDGCAMVNDASIEITEDQFISLGQTIQELLCEENKEEDEGCSDCYVEFTDENGNVLTYTWPESLHSETFKSIGELINSIAQNEVASDFLSMF